VSRPAASRDRILEIAEQVFATRGYGATSLRQLIGETGMSPTAFYARFRSKEAVLEALVGYVLGDLFMIASSTFAKAPSIDRGFEDVTPGLVASLAKHKTVIRLIMTEAGGSPTLRKTLDGAYSALASLTSSYLGKLTSRGKVKVDHTETLGWAMFGAVYVHIMRWALFEQLDDAQLGEELRITAKLLLATITRAAAT
jgi:AcrR family transcriptional regulator